MAIGAGSAVARARTVTESASDGSVTARLSYVRTRTRFEDRFSALSLTIERGGSTLLSGPLAEPCDGCALVPANAVFRQGKSIAVQDRWFLKSYRQDRRQRDFDVRGVLAAYVADQYLLGRPARGWALLRTALRRGELQRGVDPLWPVGRAYVRKLRSFLARTGY